jgi:tetratricopeptide (TPR) repeat protein
VRKSEEDIETARGLLTQAINLDSSLLGAWRNLGVLATYEGKYKEAWEYFEHSLNLSRKDNNKVEEGWALGLLADVKSYLADYTDAIKFIQESQAILIDVGDSLGVAENMLTLGSIFREQGKRDESLNCFKRALGIYKTLGDENRVGETFNYIGLIFQNVMILDSAIVYFTKSAEAAKKLNNKAMEAQTLLNIGISCFIEGDYEIAFSKYSQSLSNFRSINDKRGVCYVLNALGESYLLVGNYEKAYDTLLTAHQIAEETDNKFINCLILLNFGRYYREKNNYSQALNYFHKSLSLNRLLESKDIEAMILVEIAKCDLDASNLRAAKDSLKKAQYIYRDISQESFAVLALSWLSLVQIKLGMKEDADLNIRTVDEFVARGVKAEYQTDIGWCAWKVFDALGNKEKALFHLRQVYNELNRRAQKIKDNDLRYSFLNRVIINREIVTAYDKIK